MTCSSDLKSIARYAFLRKSIQLNKLMIEQKLINYKLAQKFSINHNLISIYFQHKIHKKSSKPQIQTSPSHPRETVRRLRKHQYPRTQNQQIPRLCKKPPIATHARPFPCNPIYISLDPAIPENERSLRDRERFPLARVGLTWKTDTRLFQTRKVAIAIRLACFFFSILLFLSERVTPLRGMRRCYP